jgi:hypothetical protein
MAFATAQSYSRQGASRHDVASAPGRRMSGCARSSTRADERSAPVAQGIAGGDHSLPVE